MKGPNGKSVLANRATISISPTIYDRRALDCTEDKALVNSLNHLTFLTSSSIKVREAMIQDGAIERLVGILYECQDPKTNLESALFAWKWVLSLQCLVLAGTRGSEKMRKKLVDAGIVPVLATILDNHFLTKKNSVRNSSNPIMSRSGFSNSDNDNDNEHVHEHEHEHEHEHDNEIENENDNENDNDNDSTSNGGSINNNSNNINAHHNTISNNNNNNNNNSNSTSNSSPSLANILVNENNNLASDDFVTEALDGNSNPDIDFSNVIINDEISDNRINNVFRQVRNLVDQANQTILEAEAEIEKHEKNRNTSKPLNNSSTNLLNDECINLLKKIEFVQFLDVINTSNDSSLITHELTTNFKDLIEDPLIGRDLVFKNEISNILNINSKNSSDLSFYKNFEEVGSYNVPRSFENGLILPTNDDVIWSLQLLAFISKYTYLRYNLASVYVINGLSFRSRNTPPPLENDSTSLDIDDLMTDYNDELLIESFKIQHPTELTEDLIAHRTTIKNNNSSNNNTGILDHERTIRQNKLNKLQNNKNNFDLVDDYFKLLNAKDSIIKATLYEKLSLKINRLKRKEYGKLRLKNKKIYELKLVNYSKKWNYDESWDELETPVQLSNCLDKEIQPFLSLNIFPLVERFTVKGWFPDDVCYWASVVVRNANRKDERMGGRRQCANFNCGKWEDRPKQFSKCRRCKRAKYCSRECQTKAWIFHKHWCIPAPTTSSSSNGNSSTGPATANTENLSSDVLNDSLRGQNIVNQNQSTHDIHNNQNISQPSPQQQDNHVHHQHHHHR